jgi:predicted RNase H-like HicB family nuclease
MKYVYPVLFTPSGGKVLAAAPDLPGLYTFGDDAADAVLMAQDAMEMWLCSAEDKRETIPIASALSALACAVPGQFVNLVIADTDAFRRGTARSFKKTRKRNLA